MKIKEYNYRIRNNYEELNSLITKEPVSSISKLPKKHFVEIYFNQVQTLNK